MNMKGEARIAGAGSTEDVPACFSFGIVYLELSRRGGKVNIGKYGSTEVDFVTQKEGVLTYYQVTADMTAEETFEREMRPLRSIQDNYEKIVLTLDRFSLGNYDGIKVMNRPAFEVAFLPEPSPAFAVSSARYFQCHSHNPENIAPYSDTSSSHMRLPRVQMLESFLAHPLLHSQKSPLYKHQDKAPAG